MPVVSCHEVVLPLTEPYKLAFGAVAALHTTYVTVEGQGRLGVGEITPLPGYNHETPELVRQTLLELGRTRWGAPQWEAKLTELSSAMPFTASGLACAMESWLLGYDESLGRPAPGPVPLTALCQAPTPEAMAQRAEDLVAEGFVSLKVKAGHDPPGETAAKVRAVVRRVGQVEVRVDANGGFQWDDALLFCREVADAPPAWLEQPFGADNLGRVSELTSRVALPIFLDEAIWNEQDIHMAADMGVRGVKLKLCKHPGMARTRRLAGLASELGLELIFGNGVQSAVGNHQESVLYHEMGLSRAAECNGFLKVAHCPYEHELRVERGMLMDDGLRRAKDYFSGLEASVAFHIDPVQKTRNC